MEDLAAKPVHDHLLIQSINSANHGWTAGINSYWRNRNLDMVKRLCGTFIENAYKLPVKQSHEFNVSVSELPKNFDSRSNWPQCPGIGHIRDQSDCGSCWAFGSTEAFNDRSCIASDGKFQQQLSAQDTTSCCTFDKCWSFGCNGGQPSKAWEFFTKEGIVSGGDYEDNGKTDTCWPYALPECSHHTKGSLKPCDKEIKNTPACRSSCVNSGYGLSFNQDRHYASSAYSVEGTLNIMREIYQHGPVTAAFTVYSDFPLYKSGVYRHTGGDQLGGHAIRIFGWGTDEHGVDYWMVANSWNEFWGDGGTFKILRGSNECGIEANISAGQVDYKPRSSRYL